MSGDFLISLRCLLFFLIYRYFSLFFHALSLLLEQFANYSPFTCLNFHFPRLSFFPRLYHRLTYRFPIVTLYYIILLHTNFLTLHHYYVVRKARRARGNP